MHVYIYTFICRYHIQAFTCLFEAFMAKKLVRIFYPNYPFKQSGMDLKDQGDHSHGFVAF